MKKNLFAAIVSMIMFFPAMAQDSASKMDKPLHFSSNQLMIKSRHQKTGAWILMGGGFGVAMIGAVISASQLTWVVVSTFAGEQNTHTSAGANVMMLGGTVAIIASIPLFISANKNKHKAQFLMRSEKVQLTPDPRVGRSQVKLGLKISI
jgi:hypothetical protein